MGGFVSYMKSRSKPIEQIRKKSKKRIYYLFHDSKYTEAFRMFIKFIKRHKILRSLSEREIFYATFKQVLIAKGNAIREQIKSDGYNSPLVATYKQDFFLLCSTMHYLIGEILLPYSRTIQAKIKYYMIKGSVYRYELQFSEGYKKWFLLRKIAAFYKISYILARRHYRSDSRWRHVTDITYKNFMLAVNEEIRRMIMKKRQDDGIKTISTKWTLMTNERIDRESLLFDDDYATLKISTYFEDDESMGSRRDLELSDRDASMGSQSSQLRIIYESDAQQFPQVESYAVNIQYQSVLDEPRPGPSHSIV